MTGPKPARPRDIDRIVRIADSSLKAGRRSMCRVFPVLLSRENASHLYTIWEDGAPVSLMGTLRQQILVYGHRFSVGNIGSVSTLPRYRGRGYGTRLLEYTFRQFEKDGVDIVLISGGRGLYRRNGCIQTGKTPVYTIGNGMRPDGICVRPYTHRSFDVCLDMYRRELLRYIRDPYAGRKMLDALRDLPWGGKKWRFAVVYKKKEPCGYFMFTVQKDGNTTVGRVREYAGERACLAAGAKGLCRVYGLSSLSVPVPDPDDPLHDLMKDAACSKKTESHGPGWTFRIGDTGHFVQSLRSYAAEKLGAAKAASLACTPLKQGGWSFSCGGKKIRLPNHNALTSLVLGAADGSRVSLPGARGALLHDLDVLFPLPLPLPGLNYV